MSSTTGTPPPAVSIINKSALACLFLELLSPCRRFLPYTDALCRSTPPLLHASCLPLGFPIYSCTPSITFPWSLRPMQDQISSKEVSELRRTSCIACNRPRSLDFLYFNAINVFCNLSRRASENRVFPESPSSQVPSLQVKQSLMIDALDEGVSRIRSPHRLPPRSIEVADRSNKR